MCKYVDISSSVYLILPFILTDWYQTVINTVDLWKPLNQSFRVKFVVVIDSPHNPFVGILPSWVEQLQVPSSFQAKHATHKARVLEWYRQNTDLTDQDWILHLDEETEIDEYLLNTCLDFIERGSEDVGMVGNTTYLHLYLLLP